jgi:hypothetical protein
MKCDNTQCEAYPIKIDFLNVIMKAPHGELKYYDKQGEEIKCSQCNEPLVEVPEEKFKGFGVWCCGFAGKTPQEKREILKKRERQYAKKDKYTQEYKKFKNNGGQD